MPQQHQSTVTTSSGPPGPGGMSDRIQNMLQSLVPIPPGELGNTVVVSGQQHLLQQQHGGFQPQHPQQQHQFRMQMQGYYYI